MDATVELDALQGAAPARFAAAGASHAGCVQAQNEDAFLVDEELGLAMAADGLGGHDGGGLASGQAVEHVAARLRAAWSHPAADAPEAQRRLQQENHVRRAVAFAHEQLAGANAEKTGRQRSGATLAGVWAPQGAEFATVFHVGDSRVYRLRDGALSQLTVDHSAYEEWRRNGEAGPPPSQKYILQALGVSQRVRPDVQSFRRRPGDRLLICTDGVCGELDEEVMAALMGAAADPRSASADLVARAMEAGGRDNLTAVVCDPGA